MNERFAELRSLITENDLRIVDAVNTRLRLVGELWDLKSKLELPVVDEARERQLREQLGLANGGPLSAEGLEELVRVLLTLTRRELGA